MQKKVSEFKIPFLQWLDGEGNFLLEKNQADPHDKDLEKNLEEKGEGGSPAFAKDPEELIKMYSLMVRTRVFDSKAIALQRTGKIGTYPSTLGQEAIGAGIGTAMKTEDVLCPYYRETPAQFHRGVKMSEILLYWGGDERGSCFADPKVKEDFPICVPIASQTLHAVGVGLAFKLRQQPRVAVTVVGDGGTSRGDFYEAMNLAGVMKLPVVFVINNNQWAISVSRNAQSAAETLAQKGIAGGIESEQVDGNDVFAVRFALEKALEKARKGGGPSVIEAITYRMGDHTTADDARRYRDHAELEKNAATDPIQRLSKYLRKNNFWDDAQEQALQKRATEEVAKAVEEYSNTKPHSAENMFDHLYEILPASYLADREALMESLALQSNNAKTESAKAESAKAESAKTEGVKTESAKNAYENKGQEGERHG